MGIEVKFNPELALRPFNSEGRLREECLSESLVEGKEYLVLKKGQRNFYLLGEVSLRQYNGKHLSKPIASITILEATHFLQDGETWTKVKYLVNKLLNPDDPPYFDGFEPVSAEANPNEVK